MCARLRGHREQAPRLALSLGTLAGLGQEQEPGGAVGQTRGRRGLGPREVAKKNLLIIIGAQLALADRPTGPTPEPYPAKRCGSLWTGGSGPRHGSRAQAADTQPLPDRTTL